MEKEQMLLIYLVAIIVLLIIYATALLIENRRFKNSIIITKNEHDYYKKHIERLSLRVHKETLTKVERDTDTDTFMRYYELRKKGITLGLKDDNISTEEKIMLMGFNPYRIFGRKSVELIDYYFDNKKVN